jgi:hypothetical protein
MEKKFSLFVTIADAAVDSAWEKYVSGNPDAVLFHHPAWFKSLGKENDQDIIRLVCKDQSGKLVGVMPMIKTRGMPFGIGGVIASRRISCLPRTPFCGPVADSALATELLIKKAVQIAQSNKNCRLQIKSMNPNLSPENPEIPPFFWRNTYVKLIPDRSEKLRFGNPRNHGRVISSVHKAKSSGALVRISANKDDLAAWYCLYLKTMQRHMVPARSFRFFSELWDNCFPKEYLTLVVAEISCNNKRRMIAGSIFLLFNQWSYYAFNGSDPDYYALRPNDYIQWHFQKFAHERGFRSLDLGEVAEGNDGLRDFKKKWDCSLMPLYHYYYPLLPQRRANKENELFPRMLLPLWRNLPVSVTSLAGRYINRNL